MLESVVSQNMSWQEAFRKFITQNNPQTSTININENAFYFFYRRFKPQCFLKIVCT